MPERGQLCLYCLAVVIVIAKTSDERSSAPTAAECSRKHGPAPQALQKRDLANYGREFSNYYLG